jgi:hypothetical protein
MGKGEGKASREERGLRVIVVRTQSTGCSTAGAEEEMEAADNPDRKASLVCRAGLAVAEERCLFKRVYSWRRIYDSQRRQVMGGLVARVDPADQVAQEEKAGADRSIVEVGMADHLGQMDRRPPLVLTVAKDRMAK